jgi:hypothetical protein
MGMIEQSELLRCFFEKPCVCSEGVLFLYDDDDELTNHVKRYEASSAIPFIRSRPRKPLLEYQSDCPIAAVMAQEIREQ